MTEEHVDEIIDYIEGEVGRGIYQDEADRIKTLLFSLFGEVE